MASPAENIGTSEFNINDLQTLMGALAVFTRDQGLGQATGVIGVGNALRTENYPAAALGVANLMGLGTPALNAAYSGYNMYQTGINTRGVLGLASVVNPYAALASAIDGIAGGAFSSGIDKLAGAIGQSAAPTRGNEALGDVGVGFFDRVYNSLDNTQTQTDADRDVFDSFVSEFSNEDDNDSADSDSTSSTTGPQ